MHGAIRAFGPESVMELRKNIIIQHDDFLKQDDHDKRADALQNMAGSQKKKFTFKETERVLHNSAMNIGEFDPRECSIAFSNLAKYAENLMDQPWRKDFHVIKLTSGFYVHNIAAKLQNAHEILIVMGYVNIDDTTLKLIPNQNYSNLKAVSRDCYVASQECLILSQIWQHVTDQEPDYPLTIGEVIKCRKNHLGNTSTICNKIIYDIRAKMHAVKQQQMLQNHVKSTQRFVPVDRLISLGADDGSNLDETTDQLHSHHNFIPEREIERSQEQLKSVNMYSYNYNDEHIYDPVDEGDLPTVPIHSSPRKPRSHPTNQQQKLDNIVPLPQHMYNSNIRKSMPAASSYQYHQQQQYRHNNFNRNASNVTPLTTMYTGDRSSVSPLIPTTVTSLFSSNQPESRNNVNKSNILNSIHGDRCAAATTTTLPLIRFNFCNQPLTRTKVKETDLDDDLLAISPRDAIPPYYNSNIDNSSLRTRKSMPVSSSNHINQNQVYPDQFYPPVILKPIARYGSSANPPSATTQFPYNQKSRPHSDNREEVPKEAYPYASEVGQLSKGVGAQNLTSSLGLSASPNQPIYQHTATPIPAIDGSDSDSNKCKRTSVQKEPPQHDRILNTGRSGSSTDASLSWEGSVREVNYAPYHHHQPHQQIESRIQGMKSSKRSSHIEIRGNQNRLANSSPEFDGGQSQQSRNKNDNREQSSSSSDSSPAPISSRTYRNEDLSSLNSVYSDNPSKQGRTDEVISGSSGPSQRSEKNRRGKSDIRKNNEHDTGHNNNTHKRSGSSSRSSSSLHRNFRQNNKSRGSNEPEEKHINDRRRVVPKNRNETVNSRRTQSPKKSITPVVSTNKNDPNHNLLSNDKPMKTPSNHHYEATNDIRTIDTIPDKGENSRNVSSSATLPPPKKPIEPWDCRFCTFRNLTEERICEVCAKSKDFYEDLQPPPDVQNPIQLLNDKQQHQLPKMYSVPNTHFVSVTNNGPLVAAAVDQEEEKECPQCTLLNSKRARICDACSFRLKPTCSPMLR